jgi:general secretion pathway protein A
MFSVPSIADELRKRERRSRPRRCCGVFDYTEFGPENGGILLDLSEGGLGFQGVAVVVEGQGIHLKFTLPGTSAHIEADAEVARCNHLRTGGGLRFVNLSEEARQQVRAWIRRDTTGLSSTVPTEIERPSASAAIDKPGSSAADSAATERAYISVPAEIAVALEPKPDEAALVASYAERLTVDESPEPTAPPETAATDADIGDGSIVNPADLDRFTVIETPPPGDAVVAVAPTAALSSPADLDRFTLIETPPPGDPVVAVAPTGALSSPDASTEAAETSLSAELPPIEPGAGVSGMNVDGLSHAARHQVDSGMAEGLAAEKAPTAGYQREATEPLAFEPRQESRATRMLLDFFGLREQPFGVSPDPAYLYASPTHSEALESLSFGIRDNRGFLALIAEPGMGKTTLLYQLLEELHDFARTAFVFQTQCDSRELFEYILHDLGVDTQGMGLVAMHSKLNNLLFEEMLAGKRCVLIVDEAQNLDDSVLETVRMLSNFETHHTKLLQIILAGQPRLATKLAQPKLSQLRQRIAVLSRLQPFTAGETGCYIGHRLSVAGYSGKPLFEPAAVNLITLKSQGIPRNINNLCYHSLLVSHAQGHRTVTADSVQESVGRLDLGKVTILR